MSVVDEMELAHCARCRRLYVRQDAPVCEGCIELEEADYVRIRDELVRMPDLSAEALAERSQVTTACVLRMLDEGLIASRAVDDGVVCGRCGNPALSARQRLCTGCMLDLNRQLSLELNEARLLKKQLDLRATAHHVHELMAMKRGR